MPPTRDGSEAVSNNLPMVLAPKLGAGEDEIFDEDIVDEHADEPRRNLPRRRRTPFVALYDAGGDGRLRRRFRLVCRLGVGLRPGALLYPPAPAVAAPTPATATRCARLKLAELSAIKANLDTAVAQHDEPIRQARGSARSARSAHAPRRNHGLDRRRRAAARSRVTPKITDRILQDWVVQDVQNGRALVESRYGGMFDVGAGSVLPGVGRVDSIKRQDGQWLVAYRARHDHVGPLRNSQDRSAGR